MINDKTILGKPISHDFYYFYYFHLCNELINQNNIQLDTQLDDHIYNQLRRPLYIQLTIQLSDQLHIQLRK